MSLANRLLGRFKGQPNTDLALTASVLIKNLGSSFQPQMFDVDLDTVLATAPDFQLDEVVRI